MVAALVINEWGELLLVKRKFEPNAGEWALPSGYMEVHLSPEENALSELREETGLTGEIESCIGWHYGYSPLYFRTISIGFRIRVCGGTLQAGDDAIEAKYYPVSALPPIAFSSHRKFIDQETGIHQG
ncbi:MAG: NUDIX domain-containing protein [Candidatus Cloacimonadaceae bacterium]|nr:NUDIX domain-containing protein [Candidatus Cloacimonadaceae bacterium]